MTPCVLMIDLVVPKRPTAVLLTFVPARTEPWYVDAWSYVMLVFVLM